jgi:hypothetical protein
VFHTNETEEFKDNYQGELFDEIDDAFQVKDVETRKQAAVDLIHKCTSNPYNMRVATVENKGRTYYVSRAIFVTTNLGADKRKAGLKRFHLLGGENLGLTDPSALEGRRNVMAWMNGPDDFELVFNDEDREGVEGNRNLTASELAALIGELIIERDKQMKEVEEFEVPKKWDRQYISTRITVDGFKVQTKEDGEDEQDEMEEHKRLREHSKKFMKFRGILEKLMGEEKARSVCRRILEQAQSRKQKWKNLILWKEHIPYKYLPFFRPFIIPQTMPQLPAGAQWIWDATNIKNQDNYSLLYEMCFDEELAPFLDPFNCFDRKFWRKYYDKFKGSIPMERTKWPLTASIMLGLVAGFMAVFIQRKILASFLPAKSEECVEIVQVQGGGQYEPGKVPIRSKQLVRSPQNTLVLPGTNVQCVHTAYNKITKNFDIVELQFENDETKEITRITHSVMLWIGGEYALLPLHVILGSQCPKGYTPRVGVSRHVDRSWRLDELEITRKGGDNGLVRFPGMMPRPYIVDHFAEEFPDVNADFDCIVPNEKTSDVTIFRTSPPEFERRDTPYSSLRFPLDDPYPDVQTDVRFGSVPNKDGMCGSIFVSQGKIVAIHQAGNPTRNYALASTLFRGDIEDQVKVQGFTVEMPNLGPISPAPLLAGVETLGYVIQKHGSFVPNKTKIKRSELHYEILRDKLGVKDTDHLPGILGKTVVYGPLPPERREIRPLENALSRFGMQSCVSDPPRAQRVAGFLPKGFNRAHLRVLTPEEAIYGIPGWIKSLDPTTSIGYWWKKLRMKEVKNRHSLFYEIGSDGTLFPRIHPLLLRDIEIKIEKFKNKICVPVLFEETLKDELKSRAKIEHPRLFSAGDLTSLIIQRMYLGSFIAEACLDPTSSPCAGGLNPHSRQWGDLYSWLRGDPRDKRVLRAGDFSKFDISVKLDVTLDFIELCMLNVCPEITIIIIWANFMGVHICGCFVFMRWWGTSSGSYITFFFNSFANWNIHKRAFVALFSEEDWDEVRCSFTGDDSILTVPAKFEKYDMAYLQKFFYDNWRMVYTSPFKDDSLEVTWDNVTYLKRTFKRGHAGVMAPLAMDSIINMVKWTDAKVQTLEIRTSIMNAVLLELWHYGEDLYCKGLEYIREEEVLQGELYVVPNWRQMVELRAKDYR